MSTTLPSRSGSGSARRERAANLPRWPESRHNEVPSIQVRDLTKKGDIIEAVGTAITCQSYTVIEPLMSFRETVAPEAVANVIRRNPQVRLLIGHDRASIPLAKAPNTLDLSQGADGSLQFRARLDMRRQDVNDLVSALRRRDISGLSIGFLCRRDTWRDGPDGVEERTILDLDLQEISFVSWPCDTQTSADVAARMGYGASVESRAQLRRLIADARAGKPLTKAQHAALTAFADNLDATGHRLGSSPARAATASPSAELTRKIDRALARRPSDKRQDEASPTASLTELRLRATLLGVRGANSLNRSELLIEMIKVQTKKDKAKRVVR